MKRITMLVLLLVTLASSMALLLPAKVDAWPCCSGHRVTIRYYSDASKTVLVGKCIEDDCASTITCTGQETDYFTVSSICCEYCGG